MATTQADATAIRPFTVELPEEALDDLRRRIAATRWPEQEPVDDLSQGVQLAAIQALKSYWETDYDFGRLEARLSALPHFITEIDGLDIHFIHVTSPHEDALPLIITHGWPGSIVEMLNVIGPLTDPTARGGTAEDAFHVVAPSMPGYGFSAKPDETGWDVPHIARAWAELMNRLGYTRYVAQGGDWGALVTEVMGAQAPEGLIGIHTNMAGALPPEISKTIASNVLGAGDPAPTGLSDEEQRVYDRLSFFFMKGIGYALEMGNRPQTLYWLTNTGVSSSRLYWENKLGFFDFKGVTVPTAVSVFPNEIFPALRAWAEQAFPNLIYFNQVDEGNHFAAWQEPDIYTTEVRAGFRSLRTNGGSHE